MRTVKDQPAKPNYFFWSAYKHLWEILVANFRANCDCVANDYIKGTAQMWRASHEFTKRAVTALSALRMFVSTVLMFTFGTVLFILAFLIHGLIIVPTTALVFVFFNLVRLFDIIYLFKNHIFIACPKCKEKSRMPTYECSCGRKHTRLYPGKYGIFKRECDCGNKLPVLNINGRRFLKAECPVCAHPIKSHEATPVCIPVIGSPSVGKTSYISATLKQLIEDMCPVTDMTLTFYDEENKRNMSRIQHTYEDGIRAVKTSDRNPLAFNFFLKSKRMIRDRLFYLYDIAGEAFHEQEKLSEQKQYEYCHGFIFIIDPLTIRSVRERYKDDSLYAKYEDVSSKTDVNDTIDAFLLNLRRLTNLGANALSKVPCAIVINKIDQFDLENILGQPAVEKYRNSGNAKLTETTDIIDELVRNYLLKNGLSNFVSQIDTQFKNNRYFTCSTQGHHEDGSDFIPVRVLEPFGWIISQQDSGFKKEMDNYLKGSFKVSFPKKRFVYAGTKYTVLDVYTKGEDKYLLLSEKEETTSRQSDKLKVVLKKKVNELSLLNIIKRKPMYSYTFLSPSDFGDDSDTIKKALNMNIWKKKIRYTRKCR